MDPWAAAVSRGGVIAPVDGSGAAYGAVGATNPSSALLHHQQQPPPSSGFTLPPPTMMPGVISGTNTGKEKERGAKGRNNSALESSQSLTHLLNKKNSKKTISQSCRPRGATSLHSINSSSSINIINGPPLE